jgi:hypothetical protein
MHRDPHDVPVDPQASGLRTELLFEASLELGAVHDVGKTPSGTRRIRYLEGGTFSGPNLRGEILPGGGDWILVRADGVRSLDIRTALRTDDGELIYVVSRGLMVISPANYERVFAGEWVDPAEYYFRTTPLFETAAEKYQWLNRTVAASVGRLTATRVEQTVYAIL